MGSLRPKLLLIVALALGPLAVASIIQGVMRLEARQQEVDEQLHRTAEFATHDEQNVFTIAEAFLNTMAQRPEVASRGPSCSSTLKVALTGVPLFLNASYIGADGTVECSAAPVRRHLDYARYGWWQMMKTSHRFTVGHQLRSPAVNQWVLPMALPLYRADGTFTGALSISLDLQWLGRTMRNANLPDTALMLILDGSGNLIAANQTVTSSLARAVAKLRKSANGDVFTATGNDGVRWRWATDRIGNTDKLVAFGMPETNLFGLSQLYFILDVLLPLLMIALASAAIWLGAERLVIRWTTYLNRVMAAYRKNHFNLTLNELHSAPTEFRELGFEMRRMANAIREREQETNRALEQEAAMGREIHHRVKNNLQTVASLINLYSANADSTEAQLGFRQVSLRVEALTLIHRMIERNESAPTINASPLFSQLADHIRLVATADGKRYRIVLNLSDTLLPIDIATPVALFAVEALSFKLFNRTGHDERRVVLSFGQHEPDSWTLTIEDQMLDPIELDEGMPSPRRLFGALAGQIKGKFEMAYTSDGRRSVSLQIPAPGGVIKATEHSALKLATKQRFSSAAPAESVSR